MPNLGPHPATRIVARMKVLSISLAVAALVAFVLLFGGCATTAPAGRHVSMGCEDPLAKDCDDPTAYPPVTLLLPPWPFPKLLVPIPEGDRR